MPDPVISPEDAADDLPIQIERQYADRKKADLSVYDQSHFSAFPCSGTIVAGFGGCVVADRRRIARVTQWSIQVSASGKKYVDTSVAGWSQFIPSILSASGAFEFKYDTDYYQHNYIWPGYSMELVLSISPTPDDQLNPGTPIFVQRGYWMIPRAVITDLAMTVDIATGDVVSGNASFTASGYVHPPQYKYINPQDRTSAASVDYAIPRFGEGLDD